MSSIEINTDERFQRLNRAPIVEAVVEFRGKATTSWVEEDVRKDIEATLEGFSFLDSQRDYKLEIHPQQPPRHEFRDLGWKGLRFKSTTAEHIARFEKDRCIFSWLGPYETWDTFREIVMQVWRVHERVAQPKEIERLGVRFVNFIPLPQDAADLQQYIISSPQSPERLDVELIDFIHQDRFEVPGHDYFIKIIRTTQSNKEMPDAGLGLIIDIDVYTTTPFRSDLQQIETKLPQMRWLKNKAFFGTITPEERTRLEETTK